MTDTEGKGPDKAYHRWMRELDREEKVHRKWRKDSQKIIDLYRDQKERDKSRYNILWANVEVLRSAVLSAAPKPDIRRRYADDDPIARQVSETMERGVEYTLDQQEVDFMTTANSVVDDFLLPGLGTIRAHYKPYFEKKDAPKVYLEVEQRTTGIDLVTGQEIFEEQYTLNGELRDPDKIELDERGPFEYGEPEEELVYEEIELEPISWKRFRWQPCEKWQDCNWCAIESFLTKEDLEEQFPEHSEHIPLQWKNEGERSIEDEGDAHLALIVEIFDKKNRKVCVISPGYPKTLVLEDDPWELECFYPFAPPLFSTVSSDKLIPIPDYMYYQDQAIELDIATNRIHGLLDQMRYRGIYDSAVDSLADVMNADDGEFVPVDNYIKRFATTGGLDSAITHMPLDELMRTISGLYSARDALKQTIYEITGIADIMRGSTQASETLGAQQLKTQFGSMRLDTRQGKIRAFMRGLVRLISEMMVEHFQPETLSMVTGTEVSPEMMAVMQNDLMRSYRVDIETDSTIAGDEASEREDRIEVLTAITGFLEKMIPLMQQGVPAEVVKELLMFGIRSFKDSRQIEDALKSIVGDEQSQGMASDPGMPTEEQPLPDEQAMMAQGQVIPAAAGGIPGVV